MRKIASIIIPLLLAAGLVTSFTACEKYVLPSVEVMADTLYFGPKAESMKIEVFTNVIVAVTESPVWVDADPAWFDADTVVTISVRENTETEARSVSLPFHSESLQRNVLVIQAGAAAAPEEPDAPQD